MWLLFAGLAGLLFTVEGLYARYILRDESDPWAYSFFFSLIGALISFPIMLADPEIPTSPWPWLLTVAAGALVVGANLLIFKSSALVEASVSGSIGKLKLVWIFLLGIAFLAVPFSWQKLLGVLLVVASGLVIVKRFRRPSNYAGIVFAFSSTIVVAVFIIISKYLFDYFNTGSLTFFVSYLPAVILNVVFMPNAWTRIVNKFKSRGKSVVAACTVGALANLALNQALSLGEATAVFVIIESFLVLTWAGEHTVLKEKESALVKLFAVLLAVAGAILMQLSS